jgi:hypothetical protein
MASLKLVEWQKAAAIPNTRAVWHVHCPLLYYVAGLIMYAAREFRKQHV